MLLALVLWVAGSIMLPDILYYQSPSKLVNIDTSPLVGVACVLGLAIAFYLTYKFFPGKFAALVTLFVGIFIEVACSVQLLKTKREALQTATPEQVIPPGFINLILAYGAATVLFFAGLLLIIKFFKVKPVGQTLE